MSIVSKPKRLAQIKKEVLRVICFHKRRPWSHVNFMQNALNTEIIWMQESRKFAFIYLIVISSMRLFIVVEGKQCRYNLNYNLDYISKKVTHYLSVSFWILLELGFNFDEDLFKQAHAKKTCVLLFYFVNIPGQVVCFGGINSLFCSKCVHLLLNWRRRGQ